MAEPRILMVGVGGLGTATVRVLWESGFTHLTLVDDDVVEESNLHRQLLFSQDDIGMPKIQAAKQALNRIAPQTGGLVLKTSRSFRCRPRDPSERLVAAWLVRSARDRQVGLTAHRPICSILRRFPRQILCALGNEKSVRGVLPREFLGLSHLEDLCLRKKGAG